MTRLLGLAKGVLGVSLDIGNMNGSAFEQGPTYGGSPPGADRMRFHELHELRRIPVARGVLENIAFRSQDACHIRFTETRGRSNQRIEHRTEIEALEPLITFSTSTVAACCWYAAFSSRRRARFSLLRSLALFSSGCFA